MCSTLFQAGLLSLESWCPFLSITSADVSLNKTNFESTIQIAALQLSLDTLPNCHPYCVQPSRGREVKVVHAPNLEY